MNKQDLKNNVSTSIFVQQMPAEIELRDESKYSIRCTECADERSKHGTRSLVVYRDGDGYIRWECFHPGCKYNVRHAAPDPETQAGKELKIKDIYEDIKMPIPFDPTEDALVNKIEAIANKTYWYRNFDGEYLFAVQRRDLGEGKKLFTPIALLNTGDWSLDKFPKIKALYGAEELKLKPEATVIVVEGEKAKDAAKEIFKNMVVITWAGGANGITRGDWDLLKGRKVLLWPDQDEAGKQAMVNISKVLNAKTIDIAYVNHLPHKSDLADNYSREEIQEAIDKKIPIDCTPTVTNAISKEKVLKYVTEREHKGIVTGWEEVDKSLRLQGLTVIEGRSSHGKTTVMLDLALNQLLLGKQVFFYSYEMPAEEIVLRLALLLEPHALHPIPFKNLDMLCEKIKLDKCDSFDKVMEYLDEQLVITDENLNMDLLEKELMDPKKADSAVFVDYIQFIPAGPSQNAKARYLQIKDYAEKMKNITKKNNLVIITGSQLTAGERPSQDVAREGKDIYNASDVVLRIWNNVEGKQTETKWSKDEKEEEHDGLILVRKARAGCSVRKFIFDFTDTRRMNFIKPEELKTEGEF